MGRLFVVRLVVDVEDAAWGDPFLALRRHEFRDSVLADIFEVFDLAHAVFRAVPMVQVPEAVAGEVRAVASRISRCVWCRREGGS